MLERLKGKKMNRTWKCSECGHFAAPNWCKVKEIKVDRNFDGPCDCANPTADKIRAMSDREFYNWLSEDARRYCPPVVCPAGKRNKEVSHE